MADLKENGLGKENYPTYLRSVDAAGNSKLTPPGIIIANCLYNKGNLNSNVNLNNITEVGIYNIFPEAGMPANAPGEHSRGILIVFVSLSHCSQLFLGSYGDIVYRGSYRLDGTGWSTWRSL